MADKLYSIRELVAPIVGGYWGQTNEDGTGNARVVRNGDVQDLGCIGPKVPLRILSEKEIAKAQLLPGDTVITMSGNVGRTAFIQKECDAQDIPYVASNFIKILRPDESKVFAKYLFYTLRSPAFAAAMRKHTRGAAMQNLSTKAFDQPIIPLPSLKEQQRIATLLDEAEELKIKRTLADNTMHSAIQALFIKMFGDPVSNSMGWKVVRLGELGSLDRGKSKHRPRNAPELYGGPYPFVQTGDITNAGWSLSEYRQTYSDKGLEQSKLWSKGTLCITIAANIARTTILEFDACFPDSVVGFVPNDSSNTDYVQGMFMFLQKGIEAMAPRAAQLNINLDLLRNLKVPCPPMELQNEFSKAIKTMETISLKQKESAVQIECLFNSLLSTSIVA